MSAFPPTESWFSSSPRSSSFPGSDFWRRWPSVMRARSRVPWSEPFLTGTSDLRPASRSLRSPSMWSLVTTDIRRNTRRHRRADATTWPGSSLRRWFPKMRTQVHRYGWNGGVQRSCSWTSAGSRHLPNPRRPRNTYVLSRYRAIASTIITRHGGTVDKYIGDGVMAVFGHVTSGPDDVDRALAYSLELVAALTNWKQTSDVKGAPGVAGWYRPARWNGDGRNPRRRRP